MTGNARMLPSMPLQTATTVLRTAEQRIAWLVDRAQISDLLVEFARAVDQRDWDAYAATYTSDGVLFLGDETGLSGPDTIRTMRAERGPGACAGTWRLSANHTVAINGDTARTRSYVTAVHMPSADTSDHASYYECALRRTDVGWRLTEVRLNEEWNAAKTLLHNDTGDKQ